MNPIDMSKSQVAQDVVKELTTGNGLLNAINQSIIENKVKEISNGKFNLDHLLEDSTSHSILENSLLKFFIAKLNQISPGQVKADDIAQNAGIKPPTSTVKIAQLFFDKREEMLPKGSDQQSPSIETLEKFAQQLNELLAKNGLTLSDLIKDQVAIKILKQSPRIVKALAFVIEQKATTSQAIKPATISPQETHEQKIKRIAQGIYDNRAKLFGGLTDNKQAFAQRVSSELSRNDLTINDILNNEEGMRIFEKSTVLNIALEQLSPEVWNAIKLAREDAKTGKNTFEEFGIKDQALKAYHIAFARAKPNAIP